MLKDIAVYLNCAKWKIVIYNSTIEVCITVKNSSIIMFENIKDSISCRKDECYEWKEIIQKCR